MKHKRNDSMRDPWDSQGNEKKNANSISVSFCLDFSIRNENITSDECKTKNRLKKYCMYCELQAFKDGWLKSCQSQTLINECSIFDYPFNFEGL